MNSKSDNRQENTEGKSFPIWIIATILGVAIAGLITVVAVVYFTYRNDGGRNGAGGNSHGSTHTGKGNTSKEPGASVEETETEGEGETSSNSDDTSEVDVNGIIDGFLESESGSNAHIRLTGESSEPVYFVAIPADEMSLRETPGLNKDVIDTLYPGTVLLWLGETECVNETYFYKVKVDKTGTEGYVSAKYCMEIYNDNSPSELDIVSTASAFYTYEMMVDDINELKRRYGDRITVEEIGISAFDRPIYAVVLGKPNAPNHIMIQSTIHGREYINSQLCMKLLEYYCRFYDEGKIENKTYREIFENTAIHVIPMSNPDGVTVSQYGIEYLGNSVITDAVNATYPYDAATLVYADYGNGDGEWIDHYREPGFVRPVNAPVISFAEYNRMWKANGRGVDLNNNFPADWNNIALKAYPCYGSYRGDNAASEPETQALMAYAESCNFKCFISYHSRGRLIYYDYKNNSDRMSQMEKAYADTVSEIVQYDIVNTKEASNVNCGGFGDWVQEKLQKPSVTIETGKGSCPVAIEEFLPMYLRHKESWARLAVAEW